MCYYKNVLYRGLSVVGKSNLFTKIMNKFIKPVETEEDYLIDSNDEIKPLIIIERFNEAFINQYLNLRIFCKKMLIVILSL